MQAHLSYIVSLKPAWATGDPDSKWPLTDTWLMTPAPIQFSSTTQTGGCLSPGWTPACGCLSPGQSPAPLDPPHLSMSTPLAPSFLPRMSSSLVPLIPSLGLNVPSEPSYPPQTTVLALTQPSDGETADVCAENLVPTGSRGQSPGGLSALHPIAVPTGSPALLFCLCAVTM